METQHTNKQTTTMPPPEMKSISFPRPSLLELNNQVAEDVSTAMLPDQLLQKLKEDMMGESNVAMTFLPAFGFLYIAADSKVHQFDPNLLEVKDQPFQIVVTAEGIVEIIQELDEAGIIKPGKNVVFRFGPKTNEQSMEQAKKVAKDIETLLGCQEIKLLLVE